MNALDAEAAPRAAGTETHATLRGHIEIARIDHWVKNVFVVPGVVAALALEPVAVSAGLALRLALGLLAVCLVASSNYVLNEILDAPYDRLHPTKHCRAVPAGRVSIPLAYVEWLALMAAGIGTGLVISVPFSLALSVLWLMGIVYNVRPIRSKDLPYVDVLSEAINNPLRMLAGWLMVGPTSIAPASLLLSYWMIGAYFMAMKRFAEFRHIGDAARAAAYRRSFRHYSEQRLLVAIMFYGSSAMLFFGAFIMRYRLELVLSFPSVALVMAVYLALAFKDDSAAQAPERLYREPRLMAAVVSCALLMLVLLVVDIPLLHRVFAPTAPVNPSFSP